MRFHQRPFRLQEIKIEVTHRCPLNCIHCSSDATPDCTRAMLEPDCVRILNEAAALNVREISFSGGEPLCWPSIDIAITTARRCGMRVVVYTSGNIPNADERFLSLKALGVDKCVLSLFGASSQSHENVTRIRGSFDRTISAIDCSCNAHISTEVHFVPLADNYRELEGIALLVRDHGVSRVSVLRFVPQGRGHLLRRHTLDKTQNVELKRTIENLRKRDFDIRLGSPYNFFMLRDRPECCSGIDRLIIGPDLRIYPCDAFKQVLAEELVNTSAHSVLDKYTLKKCWEKSPYLEAVREYLTTSFAEPCSSCQALEMCVSGCLAQKVIANGDLRKSRDPSCLLS